MYNKNLGTACCGEKTVVQWLRLLGVRLFINNYLFIIMKI